MSEKTLTSKLLLSTETSQLSPLKFNTLQVKKISYLRDKVYVHITYTQLELDRIRHYREIQLYNLRHDRDIILSRYLKWHELVKHHK